MKSLSAFILFSTVVSFIPAISHACSCMPIENFSETLEAYFSDDSSSYPPAQIVKAKILNHNEKGAELLIESVLEGSEKRSQVQILDGQGGDCNMFTNELQKDQSYVFILGHPAVYDWEKHDLKWDLENYVVSICGITYLPVKDFEEELSVIGKIENGKESNRITEVFEYFYFRDWLSEKLVALKD